MNEDSKEFGLEDTLLGFEKRQVESIFDPIKFDELFEFTTQLLLSKPIEFDPTQQTPLSNEAKLIQQFGLRGLRAAYELANGVEIINRELNDDEEMPDYIESRRLGGPGLPSRMDSAYLYPELFSGQLNPKALARTEKLGEALMDDMFRTLGQDAYTMVGKMRNAETDGEQIEVALWLQERIRKLTTTFEDERNSSTVQNYRADPRTMTQGLSFHPIRLAGKVIGTYPKQLIDTTCLGASIAAAGFMKQAGIQTLHAGVMITRDDRKVQDAAFFISELPDSTEKMFGISLPNKFIERTQEGYAHLTSSVFTDVGYHHGILFRLKSGEWMQLEANPNRTLHMNNDETHTKLDATYAFLTEMHELSPGLEVTQELENYLSFATRFELIFEQLDPSVVISQEDSVNFLKSIDTESESIPMQLYETFVPKIFSKSSLESEEAKRSLEFIFENFEKVGTDYHAQSVMEDAFYTVLEKFVFDGISPVEYLTRCKTDDKFLQRAAMDMRGVPFMMAAGLATNLLEHDTWFFNTHASAELGLPASRIGMNALADVAQFHDTAPSPTFWLSNWPSLQATTETFYLGETSKAQRTILNNNLQLLKTRDLLYSISYGKVNHIQSEFQLNKPEE